MSTFRELKEHVEYIADLANMMESGVLTIMVEGKPLRARPMRVMAHALRESLNVLVGEVERARKVRGQRVVEHFENAIVKEADA